MRHAIGIGRLGLLAVGLGIGAAMAALPGTAAADPLPPFDPNDFAISIDGMTLFHDGTASAASGPDSFAMADGPFSIAQAIGTFDSAFAYGSGDLAQINGGDFDSTTAIGTGSVATAGTSSLGTGSNFDSATADGTDSSAIAGFTGSLDTASVSGDDSTAEAIDGNFNSAIVNGINSLAQALFGNGNLASVTCTACTSGIPFEDVASAGGLSATNLGSSDIASVVGTDSTALAGSGLTPGSFDLAAVFGDMLHAAAIGVSNMVDILP